MCKQNRHTPVYKKRFNFEPIWLIDYSRAAIIVTSTKPKRHPTVRGSPWSEEVGGSSFVDYSPKSSRLLFFFLLRVELSSVVLSILIIMTIIFSL